VPDSVNQPWNYISGHAKWKCQLSNKVDSMGFKLLSGNSATKPFANFPLT
jgi:hypothetical protein